MESNKRGVRLRRAELRRRPIVAGRLNKQVERDRTPRSQLAERDELPCRVVDDSEANGAERVGHYGHPRAELTEPTARKLEVGSSEATSDDPSAIAGCTPLSRAPNPVSESTSARLISQRITSARRW
jgi:hypothetical protein